MEHGLKSSSERAEYTWASGMWAVVHHADHLLDENAARRIEEERKALCPELPHVYMH